MAPDCRITSSGLPFRLCGRETLIDQTGKVPFIALEGGFYGIQGHDGENYDPVDLPPAFQKHDLLVRFTARERKDQVSFHQWGGHRRDHRH